MDVSRDFRSDAGGGGVESCECARDFQVRCRAFLEDVSRGFWSTPNVIRGFQGRFRDASRSFKGFLFMEESQ